MVRTRPLAALAAAFLVTCMRPSSPVASDTPATAASTAEAPAPVSTVGSDPHSYARPRRVRVDHVAFDWDLSFADKSLAGSATYFLTRLDPDAPLVLDTRELRISKVEVGTSSAENQAPSTWLTGQWTLGSVHAEFGQSLSVALPPGVDVVRVHYRTGEASGLQWLEPAQTAGGKSPFLYSQSQAIHARSFWPAQDTPAVRTTFTARVRLDDPDLRVVMAAEDLTPPEVRPADGVFRFRMREAVPSYLVAVAAGDLVFRELSSRAGVWGEPSVVDRAAHEFADTESMIAAAEALYGPYRWGRYDILVLPPAFPFGGMENPRLTFATPTILAGDRSLVSLVAHELAHSWSGNLVTNSSWADLWLNEGFTTYFERRLMEELYGRERAEMETVLGLADLEMDFEDTSSNSADQHLHINLNGRDPDQGMTAVPYEKGALMLRTMEDAWGRAVFDEFLRGWFDAHAFQSVDANTFLGYFQAHLANKPTRKGRVPVGPKDWIYAPGVPKMAARPEVDAFERVDGLVKRFLDGRVSADRLPVKDWTPHHWIYFLQGLEDEATPGQLQALDTAHGLTAAGNNEILAVWLRVSIKREYRGVDDRVETFLVGVGRRKFLTPLYKALAARDQQGEAKAREIYARARGGYHAIARATLDDLLGY